MEIMAKSKKKKGADTSVAEEASSQAQDSQVGVKPSPAATEAPATFQPVVSMKEPVARLALKDAAARYILGYKDHHWAGIRKHADHLGFGEDGTVSECKEVFRSYGAKIRE
jgi:hypothetical protein